VMTSEAITDKGRALTRSFPFGSVGPPASGADSQVNGRCLASCGARWETNPHTTFLFCPGPSHLCPTSHPHQVGWDRALESTGTRVLVDSKGGTHAAPVDLCCCCYDAGPVDLPPPSALYLLSSIQVLRNVRFGLRMPHSAR